MSLQSTDQTAKGVVQTCTNEYMDVRLNPPTGCQVCSKGLCFIKGDEKIIRLQNKYHYHEGDAVTIHVCESTGTTAVMLFYFIPFLLMTTTLALLVQSGFNEGIAGLTSLLILIPYFLLLRLNRNWMSRQCKLEIEPA